MAEKITLTNREILKLHEGLSALDGLAEKDGSVVRFKFEPKVVWDLAKNHTIVERTVEAITRARKKLGAQYGVVERMRLTESNAPKVAEYVDANEKLLDEQQTLEGVLRVALSELQKNDNQIPPGVLAALMPIIKDK